MACCNDTFDTYMSKYLGLTNEADLEEIFNKHDKDGNGFIDGNELDGFIKDIFTKQLPASEAEEFKKKILEKVDNNNDGKIDKNELRAILPTEENFLNQFRNVGKKICGVDFMKIWNHYDKDESGKLDGDELDEFIKDLILKCYPNTKRDDSFRSTIKQCKKTMLDQLKLENEEIKITDLFDWFKVEAICPNFEGDCCNNFDTVFSKYDKDNSGEIDGDELAKFLSALFLNSEEKVPDEIKDIILTKLDKNKDKKIQKNELKEYLNIKE